MKVTLCGMMGCGKTTVGRVLSKRLGVEVVDTDALIEEKYGKISSIFATQGESYFRDLETECAKELADCDGLVIAVGGGFVLRQENVECLKRQGKIVYLSASKETLLARLKGDSSRPLLQAEALSDKLDELMKKRSAVYEKVCDFSVEVDKKTPQEVAEEIAEELGL